MATILPQTLLLLILPLSFLHAEVPELGPIDPGLSYRVEFFSLPQGHAATLLRGLNRPGGPNEGTLALLGEESAGIVVERGHFIDADLYDYLIDPPNEGAVRLERLVVLRGWQGQRVRSISRTDYLVPERDDLDSPEEDPDEGDPAGSAMLQALAQKFDDHHAGITVDLDASRDASGTLYEVGAEIESVDLAGQSTWGQGADKVEMPEFDISNINQQVLVTPGQPFLLGTMDRQIASAADPEAEVRIWLVFITLNLVQVGD